MAYETDNLLHGRTSNPWDLDALARRLQRRRIRSDRRGHVRAGLGSTAAAPCACPRTSPASARSSPRPAAFRAAAICRHASAHFQIARRHRPHGAHHRRCHAAVSHLSGQDPDDPASPPVLCANPVSKNCAANTIGFFEDDGLVPSRRRRAPPSMPLPGLREAGFRVEPFRARHARAAAQAVVDKVLRAVRRHVLCARHSRASATSSAPSFKEFLGIAEAAPPLSSVRPAQRLGRTRSAARAKTLEEMRVSRPALPRAPAFPHSATANARGPSTGALSNISMPCGTRSGSTCSPPPPRLFP
jgi:hypothetical protein